MGDHVKQVENLKLEGNLSENWTKFKRNFDIFMKSDALKITTFLNAIGENAVDVFDTFDLTDEQKGKYDEVIKAFADFCTTKKNKVYERFVFYLP